MVILLVLLTIGVVIGVQAIVQHRKAQREAPAVWVEGERPSLSPALVTYPKGHVLQFPKEVYYHDGHAWAKIIERDSVKVGLDDLTQSVMGEIEEIEIPKVGSKLKQGKVAWKIRHGRRKLGQLAPLGGRVVEVNEKLIKNPSLANRSPYEEGWILKIQPEALGEEIPKLMDSLQTKMHFDQTKADLRYAFGHEALGVVYGDGEEVISGASDKLDEKSWKVLVTQLFHTTPNVS